MAGLTSNPGETSPYYLLLASSKEAVHRIKKDMEGDTLLDVGHAGEMDVPNWKMIEHLQAVEGLDDVAMELAVVIIE
ncbi:hypothetical protein V493_05542 [Pseudogymnoascus sp. VKM F-4281 (FW-2241)]|nr:hypothetical protein V493_05542 [Pseudogymnoascus sp. VKM F-4281 (FW-2241)]